MSQPAEENFKETHVPEGWPELTPSRRTQLAKRAGQGSVGSQGSMEGARGLLIAGSVIAFAAGLLVAFFVTSEHGLMAGSMAFVCTIVSVAIYFIPAFIAHIGSHPRATEITLLNFLAGWLVIGWLAALIWALVKPGR